MNKASATQIGGDHYKAGKLGHWDYCDYVQVPYLESAATKYIVRYRNKNGLQDLEKSRHYMIKRLEAKVEGTGPETGATSNDAMFDEMIHAFELSAREIGLVNLIMHWKTKEDIKLAVNLLTTLIDQVRDGIEEEIDVQFVNDWREHDGFVGV